MTRTADTALTELVSAAHDFRRAVERDDDWGIGATLAHLTVAAADHDTATRRQLASSPVATPASSAI